MVLSARRAAGMSAGAVLLAVGAAAAEPTEARPFVGADLTARTTVGVATLVGPVTLADVERTVASATVGAAVQVAPRARISVSYGLGWIEGYDDSTASAIPARGDLTAAVTWLRPTAVARWGVTAGVSLPVGGDKLGAAARAAWLHAGVDGSPYDNRLATARLAIDGRRAVGSWVAQGQLGAQLRFGARSDDDSVVGSAAVSIGRALAPALTALVAASATVGAGDCAVVCDESATGTAAAAVDVGLRYEPRWGSLGLHALVPVSGAARDAVAYAIGLDVAFAIAR